MDAAEPASATLNARRMVILVSDANRESHPRVEPQIDILETGNGETRNVERLEHVSEGVLRRTLRFVLHPPGAKT